MKNPIHFFHANGFPAETYQELLSLIDGDIQDPLSVIGKQIPEVKEGYHEFTDEIIEHASKTHGEGIAIGHSFGGTLSLLSEAREPGLFKNIILLDPPIFSHAKRIILSFLRKLGLEYLVTPAKKSMKRRESFNSREEALDYFSSKTLFKEVPKTTIEHYVQSGLEERNGTFQLVIPRQRETEIFLTLPTQLPREIRTIQGDLIYADKVRLLDDDDLKWWGKAMPEISRTPFQGSHMFLSKNPKNWPRKSTVFWIETYKQLELCDEIRSEVRNLVIEKSHYP